MLERKDDLLEPKPWWRDIHLHALLLAGFGAWLLPPPVQSLPVFWIVAKALAEELAFRWGLQEVLERRWSGRDLGPFSAANWVTSILFAALHLIAHPPLWAAATLLPSLAFGHIWTRHRQLVPCVLLHVVYNLLYFYRP